MNTSNYLTDLINQKAKLVSTLQKCRVETNENEKFNTLIPKVEEANSNLIFKGVIADDLEISNGDNLSHDSLMSIINILKNFKTYKTYTYSNGKSWDNISSSARTTTFTVTSNNSDDLYLRLSGVDENNQNQFINIFYHNGTDEYFYELANCPLAELDIKTCSIKPVEGAEDIVCWFDLTYVIADGESTVTKTLTIGVTNLNKLSEQEKEIAINKGWILK